MAHLADIVFDCEHPAALARFWADALDDYVIAPYDHAELERLRSLGVADVEDDPTVLIESSESGPRLWFQRVPEPKASKNRVHLDVRAADRRAEIARLVALGATVVVDRDDATPTVLRDPEGNEFCIVE